MGLDTFIMVVFCLIDTRIRAGRPLRSRGPAPTLADSEVVTMELVGEFLGLDQDKAIYRYFRSHYSHFFAAIGKVHPTTFCRQAANRCACKQRLWQELLPRIPLPLASAWWTASLSPSARQPAPTAVAVTLARPPMVVTN